MVSKVQTWTEIYKWTHSLFKRQVQYTKRIWANKTLEKVAVDEM